LIREGNDLKITYGDVYCTQDQEQYYWQHSFRGYDYFATFSDAQYQAVIVLLRYLTGRYNIPREILPEARRYAAGRDVLSFAGIVSHVNYRATGKTDIGPAFDWQRISAGLEN